MRMSAEEMASSMARVPRPRSGVPTTADPAPCTCSAKITSSSSTPKAPAARSRLTITLSGSSPTCNARFNDP